MGRRQSKEGLDLNFKEMMSTPVGKWFLAPALMAMLATAAWGLLLTGFQLQNGLPSWVYSLPVAPTVLIYYGLQLRKVWHLHVKPELTIQKDSQGVARQTVKDNAIVPNIQGNNNVIHQTIVQAPLPRRRETPKPAANLLQPMKVEPLAVQVKDVPSPVAQDLGAVTAPGRTVILHDGEITVAGASHEAISFDFNKGEAVKGTILADASVNAFIMGEKAYHAYWESREVGSAKCVCNDERTAQFRWTAPRSGRFFLVLDTFNKQAPRRVKLRLERLAPPVATPPPA